MESERNDADDGPGNKLGCPNWADESILNRDNAVYWVLGDFRPTRGSEIAKGELLSVNNNGWVMFTCQGSIFVYLINWMKKKKI